MQLIIMTSDKQKHCHKPFMYLFNKCWGRGDFWAESSPIIEPWFCGFTIPENVTEYHKQGFHFYSIGEYEDYPANRWSDALLHVLDNVAEPQFLLMLEDYWPVRPIDTKAIKMLFDYASQFSYVLKIDVANERLNNRDGNGVLTGKHYGHVGYVDLIKSPPGSSYQMSLWGGIWNRDTMKAFIVPGEKAQEIEIFGTSRVNEVGDNVLVLGTKQAPLMHANVYLTARGNEPDYSIGDYSIAQSDIDYMREEGWIE